MVAHVGGQSGADERDRAAANMNDIVTTLQHSTSLVKAWGHSRALNGKTLAETLTLQEFPLWESVAVDLARIHVPKALLGTRPPSFAQRIRPYLSWSKHVVHDPIRSRWDSQGCAGWPQSPVFLFLGFGAYIYRDVLQPVVACLAGCNDVRSVSLYDDLAPATAFPVAGNELESVWQHWDGQVQERAYALRRELQAIVARLRASGALPLIIQDQGRPLWPQMKHSFNWLFRVHLPRLVSQAAIAQHLLERHRPALVISPDVADPRARLYCLLGSRLGIPSLQIQFGACGADAIEWQFFVGDRLAVWGKEASEVMLAHNVPAELITVTGSPRHDSLVRVADAEVARTRARLGVPTASAMVLFASAFYLDAHDSNSDREILRSVKRAIFEAADRVAGLQVVVKPHPLEAVKETRHLAGARRNILFADPRDDIRELTNACDAFVTLGSTATFDALIANKLTIGPVFPGWSGKDLPFYANSGAVVVVRSLEEIVQSFQLIADGSSTRVLAELEPARQRLLRHWVHRVDGQASVRVVALAREMAKTSLS